MKENKVIELFVPNEAQIEALYELENSREEDFDNSLVVSATGVEKTYLAAILLRLKEFHLLHIEK